MHISSIESMLKRKDEEIDKLKDNQRMLYTYSCNEEVENVRIYLLLLRKRNSRKKSI